MTDSDPNIEGEDLTVLVAEELRSARKFADTELSEKRARNLEYYNGTMKDLPSPTGRSSVVSRDVSDVIGWMLPGIIRVFTAADNMVMYEPEKEGDEAGAEQATDYINYCFFRDNEGYRTLYNITHDSLIGGNGIVYHYWDPTPDEQIDVLSGQTEIEIAVLTQDESVEIISQEQGGTVKVDLPDPVSGQPVPTDIPVFNLKIRRTMSTGRLDVHACKPENFFLDAEATTIAEARFVGYLHENKTRSALIEMGFDRGDVMDLPSDASALPSEEASARDDDIALRTRSLKSQERIDLYECYVKADEDDDGVSETLQVWYAGNIGSGRILDWQVWEDDVPFTDVPCYPVPHRWDADSAADRTTDIQKTKSALLRQGLDNLYASNLPMMQAEAETVLNPEILARPKFGATIWRSKGSIATSPVTPIAVPFVADKVFTALDYMDMVVAKRTGVSRTTMALDPEALQNQTATANQNQRDAGYSQIELVARNQAELGWKRVFQQLLKLVVKHQDRPRVIRLRDKFVPMDPRSWNANMDATVNVGLGTGSRDRDMMMLQQVLIDQVALADRFTGLGAMDRAIDLLPKIVTTMKKKAESAGLKNPDAYYPTYGEQDVAQLHQQAAAAAAQPDPKIALEQEKAKADLALSQQKQQADERKAQHDASLDQMKMQADIELRRYQIDSEIMLKREQLAAELELKRQQLVAEIELKREFNQQTAAATSEVRPGGEPG